MKFEIVPAHDLSFAEQAETFATAFTGYVGGTFQMNAATLGSFIAAQGIDLCYSRFARNSNGQLVSFGYINRTANFSRLAGMGTIETARRTGAAGFVLSSLLEEAKLRGDVAMILEVIEQNPPAVKLYQRYGFNSLGRLLGWRGKYRDTPSHGKELTEISVLDATCFHSDPDYPGLPWQVSRHAAAKVAGVRAFALGQIGVIIGDTRVTPVRLHGFPGADGANWESLRELVQALLVKFPGTEFYAPPIFPEEFGEQIFRPTGFEQEKLSQFLMRKDL